MRKVSLFLLFLLLCPLLGSCVKAEPYAIPIVDGDSGESFLLQISSAGDISLSALLPDSAGPAALYTNSGDIIKAEASDVLFKGNGGVEIGGEACEGLCGIILNCPDASVMDVYSEAKSRLEAGEKVLILYLDGFGYESFAAALDRGDIPSLASLKAVKAMSAFPTITPVNYAAMVTGEAPAVSGVTGRGIHTLSCPSIFDFALETGKAACVVEGDSQILAFSVPQELNPDMDGDGDTDDEVMETALNAMEGGAFDLILVHLHGIDDVSHANGPYSEAAAAKIVRTDLWADELFAAWDGAVIVVADHGQHENDGNQDSAYDDKKGVHGAFAASDIFVPLLIG